MTTQYFKKSYNIIKTKDGMRLTILLIFFLFSFGAMALNTVKVKVRTGTGKTVVLNVGSLGNIREGDRAVLVYTHAMPNEVIESDLVAQIRAVKVDDSESIWYATEVYDPEALSSEDKFQMLAPKQIMFGRKDYKIKNRVIIKNSKQNLDTIESDLEKGWDESELDKKSDNYYSTLDTHKRTEHFDEDFELADVYEWVEKDEGTPKLYTKQLYRSPYRHEFEQKMRLETFEKVVMAHIEKANSGYHVPARFYEKVLQDKNIREFQTEYAKTLLDRKDRQEKFDRKYDEIFNKGPAWSDDISDEDLAHVLTEYGIATEMKRRESVFLRRYNFLVHFAVGMNMQNNETDADPSHGRHIRSDFQLGLEMHLLKRFPALEAFTLEASMRRSRDSLAIDAENALTADTSFALSLDYHPFTTPGIVGENIVFVGTTLRMGRTKVEVPNSNAQAIYGSSGIFGLRGGVKYHMDNGWGFRLMASYENIGLDKTEANNVGAGLPAKLDLSELKFTAGLNYFF
ncbi:MAG: hypothetical protein JNM93_11115 [Bacteriovoracaceae bacterium]|nr:hypothetical protein [Bacteriovoracaceae bacterium]